MNSKFVLLCLFGLIAVASGGKFCGLCEKMITDEITKYNGNFSTVTQAQLETDMEAECKKYTSGIERKACESEMKKISGQLLADLKKGDNAETCCKDGKFC